MKIIEEFKTFAIKGNAVDLAIGVVIGAAFNDIVNSIVNDIINPIVGLLTGPVDLSEKVFVLREGTGELPAISINYGNFIMVSLNFIIIALILFIVVKQMNKLRD